MMRKALFFAILALTAQPAAASAPLEPAKIDRLKTALLQC